MTRRQIAVVWCFSLLPAFLAGYLVRPKPAPTVSPTEIADSKLKDIVEAADSENIEALHAEIADLRAKLLETRNQNLRDALSEVLESAANSNAPAPIPGSDNVASFFDRQLSVIASNKNQWFGGLEASLSVLVTLARLGDEGTEFLLSVVEDEAGYTEDERTFALEMLARIPDQDSLEYLLQRPSIESDEYDSADLIAAQVYGLPTKDLEKFGDRLWTEAATALDTANPDLAIGLAFLHGDSRALARLNDPQFWMSSSVDGVMDSAARVHTESARAFLEKIAGQHPDAESRARANEYVQDWAGPEESVDADRVEEETAE
ncbi:MAG: hypothetical protein SGI88_08760 [Candidatus Hydrogenedentes bacterium]|nr:hypothetical protein [Candidatus Hydrogenedentota bacterium]